MQISGEDADGLAAELSAGLERVVGLLRALSQPSGLSLTAVATMAALERTGPGRLTALAAMAGVTQPAMTQLVSRLEDAGLVRREAARAGRLAVILGQLSPGHRAALAAALPALDALASARRDEEPVLA